MSPILFPVAIGDTSSILPAMPRPKKINTARVHNRIFALMAHTRRYAFKGETRLAADAGVSKSAVCRLLNGRSSPSYALVLAVTSALEKHLGHSIDPRDVISADGRYPTASACELAGCKGCLPAEAYDENDQVKPQYRHLRPGQWTVAVAAAKDDRLPLVEKRQDA